MKNETLGIGILSLTGLVLAVACYFAAPPQPAVGMTSIKDRDYQMATARNQQGGEGLYVLDNRTGNLTVFTYDPVRRQMVARAVRPVAELFAVEATGATGR